MSFGIRRAEMPGAGKLSRFCKRRTSRRDGTGRDEESKGSKKGIELASETTY
jgi:hypothetical protein